MNGLHAALRKGYDTHAERLDADASMLQELRVLPEQPPDAWNPPSGWRVQRHPAERERCSGTTTPARTPLRVVGTGIDGADDSEGRMPVTRLEGIDLTNIQLPTGASSPKARRRKGVEPAPGCRARIDSCRHSWFIFGSPTRRRS